MASRLESLSKWLQLKIYQLEVTMSVYIYTPIEKFIFCKAAFSPFDLLPSKIKTRNTPSKNLLEERIANLILRVNQH